MPIGSVTVGEPQFYESEIKRRGLQKTGTSDLQLQKKFIMRGRKPTPTALKMARCNPGKRVLNDSEPKPGRGDRN
jgi:hypothetical protein